MNKQTIHDEIEKLSKKAQALVTATVTATGEELEEAWRRLAAALDNGREIYNQVRSKEAEGACAVKKALNEHTIETMPLALGIGYFTSRRCPAKCE